MSEVDSDILVENYHLLFIEFVIDDSDIMWLIRFV